MNALARLLAVVAADLETRGYPYAGVVLSGARALNEFVSDDVESDSLPVCGRCGRRFKPSRRGRPRKLCRRCSGKRVKKTMLGSTRRKESANDDRQ